MTEGNLFALVVELIKADPPPFALSAWGFGSYVATPHIANDVDVLLVFDNSAIHHLDDIRPYSSKLQESFFSRSGKALHLERLTEKECGEVDFIREASAVRIWTKAACDE